MQTSQMIHSFDDSCLGHNVSDKWNNATFELRWKIRSWNWPVADCGAGICHCVNQRHVDTKYIIMYFLRKCHCFLYYECFEYTYEIEPLNQFDNRTFCAGNNGLCFFASLQSFSNQRYLLNIAILISIFGHIVSNPILMFSLHMLRYSGNI